MVKRKETNVERMEKQRINERIDLQKRGGAQRMPDKDNFEAVVNDEEYEVRRLTPTECARLQGFPPDWCADVPHSDSAEYKLWGNGIALPSILPMMQNAVNLVEEMKGEK